MLPCTVSFPATSSPSSALGPCSSCKSEIAGLQLSLSCSLHPSSPHSVCSEAISELFLLLPQLFTGAAFLPPASLNQILWMKTQQMGVFFPVQSTGSQYRLFQLILWGLLASFQPNLVLGGRSGSWFQWLSSLQWQCLLCVVSHTNFPVTFTCL